MAEYIEREALEVALNYRLNFLMAENGEYDHYTSGFDEAVTRVENFPAADVVPARHGRWTTTYGEVFPGSSQFLCYSHKHEECGFRYVDMDDNEYDYCPKCGAKMDGKT